MKKYYFEMYADKVMERVLGLTRELSPKECFDYWYSRICPDDVAYVRRAVRKMIRSGKALQLEYRWNHPTLGEVGVRSSGIRVRDDHGKIVLEGYHRLLAGVDTV
jgi:hypothetical protein